MDHGHRTGDVVSEEAGSASRRWLTLTVLALAQFMLIVDITAVHVALASIGADLALGREALTWVVTTYTLVFGGLMALGGRLADAYGPGECCWWGSRCSHSRLWRAAWHRTARG